MNGNGKNQDQTENNNERQTNKTNKLSLRNLNLRKHLKFKIGCFFWEIILFTLLSYSDSRLNFPIPMQFLLFFFFITFLLELIKISHNDELSENEEIEEYEEGEEHGSKFLLFSIFVFIFILVLSLFIPNLFILKILTIILIFLIFLYKLNSIKIFLKENDLYDVKIIISIFLIFLPFIILFFMMSVTIPNILFILIYSLFNLSVFFDDVSGRLFFGIVLVVYMFLLYPILNVWIPIISTKIGATATTMGINYHISSNETFFGYLKNNLNNTILLLTNPQKYYQEQFLKNSGKREKGVSDLAVILNKITLLPKEAFPSTLEDNETTTLLMSFSNEGDQKATDVIYGIDLGKESVKNGAAIENSSNYLEGVSAIDYTPLLLPGEKMLESFQILTPFCSGVYTGMGFIQYEYPVNAYLNLEFMDKSYYDELLKRKIITGTEKITSYCSAGPIKLTIAVDKFQPIPIGINEKKRTITFYITLQNVQSGHALLRNLEFFLPKIAIPKKDDKDSDFCNYFQKTENKNYLILKLDLSKFKKSGKLCLNPKQMQVFTCSVTFNLKQHPMPISMFTIKANASYIYRYYKSFSFTVMNTPELKLKKGGCYSILQNKKIQKIIHERQNPNYNNKINLENKVCGGDNDHCYFYVDANYYTNVLVLGYPDITKYSDQIKKEILSAIFVSMSEERPYKLKIVLFTPKCNESLQIDKNDISKFKNEYLEKNSGSSSKYIAFLKSSKVVLNRVLFVISPKYIYTLTFDKVKGKCGIFNLYVISVNTNPLQNVVCELNQYSPCVDTSQCKAGYSCLNIYDYLAYESSNNPLENVLNFLNKENYFSFFNNIYLQLYQQLPEDLRYPVSLRNFISRDDNNMLFFCKLLNEWKEVSSTKNYFSPQCQQITNRFLSYESKSYQQSNIPPDAINSLSHNKFWNNVLKIYSQVYSGTNSLVKIYFPKNGQSSAKEISLPVGICRNDVCSEDAGNNEYSTNIQECECHKTFKVLNLPYTQYKCEGICNLGVLSPTEFPCMCEYLSLKKNINTGSTKTPPNKYTYFQDYFKNYYDLLKFEEIKRESGINYATIKNGKYVCNDENENKVLIACCLIKKNNHEFIFPVVLHLSCYKKIENKIVTLPNGTKETTSKTYYYWKLTSESLVKGNNDKYIKYINTCNSSKEKGWCVENEYEGSIQSQIIGPIKDGDVYLTTISTKDNICSELIEKEYVFSKESS